MRFLAGVTILFLLASCVQVPKQEPYQLFDNKMASQKKLQAADHWNKLSNKLVAEWAPVVKEEKTPLFIYDGDNSPFGRAMRTFLTTDFFNQGVQLGVTDGSFKLMWEIQSVYHYANRINKPGLLEILLLDLPQVILVGELDGGYEPHTEVIITFNLIKNNLMNGRKTAIFYINDADIYHYRNIQYPNYQPSMPVIYSVMNNR
jgi:hypothetical protein